MAAIPAPEDPTLSAADRALEQRENRGGFERVVRMSAIGHPCERALFYRFRWAGTGSFTADTLKRFADGHHGEMVMAARLRLVEGVTLWTIDPATGRQFEFSDHDGHFLGHIDGVVSGLLQAPKSPHVWEHKQVEEKSQRELEKLKTELGEKNALREWKPEYWAQAQIYMHYTELERHYLTVSSPGGRRTISCRTNYNRPEADKLEMRARSIIKANRAPPRVSEDPAWYLCRWCEFHAVCHQGKLPLSNCRTCLHSSPVAEGGWHCGLWSKLLTVEEQHTGCPGHLYLPSLIDGEQVDADDHGEWVEYRMRDGNLWRDEVAR
jgi:hypothetical protein